MGRAGSGKTAGIIREIAGSVAAGVGGSMLIVPEQYSHEAERELAGAAGDGMSLYAEVLSFTGLARRVEAELGSGGRMPLDAGGRLLCMASALEAIYTRLAVYGGARRSPELQSGLLAAVDELKAARATPESLLETAQTEGGALGMKLRDLALILAAYDAAVGAGHTCAADRLTLLLDRLPRSVAGRGARIYIDGFTDFTAQESAVVSELMGRCSEMTVCLTVDGLYDGSEVFEISRRTARALLSEASERGIETRVEFADAASGDAIGLFTEHMFDFGSMPEAANGGAVSLYYADGVTAECEFAASRCVRLAEDGCRWRDIAVAARSFEDYRPSLEAAFARYGVPLFTARKADILQKPLPSLIASAYEIPAGGWECGEVFSYLRTGFAGLTMTECDTLENYCLMWGVGAPGWLSPSDWRMHPGGYGLPYDDKAEERLAEINGLRRRASAPLVALANAAAGAGTAAGQARALADFLEGLGLAEALAARADELEAAGRPQAASELARLWDITAGALGQFTQIMGDAPMDAADFSRLFLLTLSQYDVGVIPVSLDMVSAGDMDRMRRRRIRHLIVLGASDERLPRADADSGVFTPDERRELTQRGLRLDAGDAELWREWLLIYNCLSLPSDTLCVVSPAWASDGKPARASFVMTRASKLFGIPILHSDPRRVKLAAAGPALELAAASLRGGGDGLSAAAAEYFRRVSPGRLEALERAAAPGRGRLSSESVNGLYGSELRLTASRIDKFSSCRFAYFLNYGLKVKPRRPAEFSPPEFGSFMHYVLQNTAAEVMERGGFRKVGDGELAALTDKYVEQCISDELRSFADRPPRFVYLFRRLTASVRRIVADMADELRHSDFEPLDFELDFSRLGRAFSTPLPDGGKMTLSGMADRVDGWMHNGRLYLRVVDYKTGRKSFSLSDVWYGMGLQMLLYLFTLEKAGPELYGREVSPAGVLYVPARDVVISASADMDDDEIAAKRLSQHRRSGLVLDDAEVLRAMERSDAPTRLPVKWKGGAPTGDSLASAERLGALGRRVDDTLRLLAVEIRRGSIAADPYYKAPADNACLYCDFADACRFADGEGDDRRRYLTKKTNEEVWSALEGGGENG